eukprot:PITA_03263
MIKNETQQNIGILRTDNSVKYTSHAFEEYLKDNGIKHQTTIPYNPQQNVVVEFREPSCFEEAANCGEWKDAMKKEYDSFIKNGNWRLVDPPVGVKPIGCKWVYKIKYKVDGSLDKYKARLVAKGYAQKEGVDYTEKFSPTTKWGTIRDLFSLAAQNN